MLDRHVLEPTILPPVAGAVVLHLDDDAPQLAAREAQHVLDDGCVPAGLPDIPDQDSQSSARQQPVKEVEFDALSDARPELGADVPEGDFFARALPPAAWEAPWTAPLERVVLVHRLREVIAQVGFTRFEAAGPDIQGELDIEVQRAPVGLDASWLPAIENRGEGVFLQFKPQAIEAWLERPAVKDRDAKLQPGFELWKKEHDQSKRAYPGLPYFMLHSLSHLLLTAISLECG